MKKYILLASSIMVLLALSGCSSTVEDPTTNQEALEFRDSGKISATEDITYDWNDIDIMGGTVSKTFTLKNDGPDDLVIRTAQTSCMCTSAQVILKDGTTSPLFGMHGTSPWGEMIKPGETFDVEVIFDPMAHGPKATGPIERSIYIETSSVANGNYAKIDPKLKTAITELKLSGDVLTTEDFQKKNYEIGFMFEQPEHDFGTIKQSGGLQSHNFEFTYNGPEPISITGTPTSCACTAAKISAQKFNPGDKGTLTVILDPNLHEEPVGQFFKTVSILTDPPLKEKPEVKIWLEIDLDLGAQAYKLRQDHNDDDNHSDGTAYHNIQASELPHMLENKDFFLLDVHTPEQEHIAGTDAIIPYDQIDQNLSKLPKDKSKPVVVYCRSGSMSIEASQKLIDLGYTDVKNLQGGRNAYIKLTE